jgi:hypothetical protein
MNENFNFSAFSQKTSSSQHLILVLPRKMRTPNSPRFSQNKTATKIQFVITNIIFLNNMKIEQKLKCSLRFPRKQVAASI